MYYLKLSLLTLWMSSTTLIAQSNPMSTEKQTRRQQEQDRYAELKANKAYTEIPGVALYKKTVRITNGRQIKPGDYITIHYKGTLMNGKTFDSSYKRNDPFKTFIGVGRLIRGWDDVLTHFSEGERGQIVVTPQAGYGKRRMAGIPANSYLIFDIEIIKVETK